MTLYDPISIHADHLQRQSHRWAAQRRLRMDCGCPESTGAPPSAAASIRFRLGLAIANLGCRISYGAPCPAPA